MGKWSREFRSQLFGGRRKRESSGQRYIRLSGNRTRRKQARQMNRAKNFYKRHK